MFKRGKTQQFEITEHPEVIAALNAMWQQAYDAGRRDAVAIVTDFREELADRGHEASVDFASEVIERLEV